MEDRPSARESPPCQAFTSNFLLLFSPLDLQLMFEVERGSHAAFVVALGFIFISQGTCRGRTGPQAPEKGPHSGMSSTRASLHTLFTAY